jgi:hypothetical protein
MVWAVRGTSGIRAGLWPFSAFNAEHRLDVVVLVGDEGV